MYLVLKRIVDILVSGILLILFSPLMLVLAILIRSNMGSPVFFTQNRPGLNERIFTLRKFRTMHDAIGADGQPLPDSERLTALGLFIRKTSLDELPQLINVFLGDMSLIGPRPLLVQYLPLYNQTQKRRHEVRPGITGWAQVNGRNAISWEERFELDVWYVDNCSLMLDLQIVLKTIKAVFKREGISQQGHATMPFFEGSDGASQAQMPGDNNK